jgi:hypothetical protein
MSRIAWLEILVGAAFYAGAMLSASASSQSALEEEIAAVTERAYLGPREALYTIAKMVSPEVVYEDFAGIGV